MDNNNSKRLAKNTVVLYFRMLFSLLVSLYTSRVVLNALGVDDYGVYNAVAGFVAMFSLLSNSLTSSISRYLTYGLGKGDVAALKETFSAAIIIEFILVVIVVLLAETFGLWFLNTTMQIPDGRITAANIVFQLSILTFSINLISVPYNASIISHEHITTFAYVGIIRSCLTLAVALIVDIAPVDKLVLYAALLALISLAERVFYGFYCSRKFVECHIAKISNKVVFKQLCSFAGWNFFGTGSAVLRDQGLNMLINVFCGPAVNAARGIAMQVSSAVSQFSSSFITSINPQITKTYASGDIRASFRLVFMGTKLTFFLLMVLSIPVIFETSFLLTVWLKIVPTHTVSFVRLIILYVMIESLSYTMTTLMLATGDIKKYQIVVGTTQLLNFPVALLLLWIGYAPECTIWCNIVIAMVCLVIRLKMLQQKVEMDILAFFKDVLLRIVLVFVLACVTPYLFVNCLAEGFPRIIVMSFVSLLSSCLLVLLIGLNVQERNVILQLIRNKIKR